MLRPLTASVTAIFSVWTFDTMQLIWSSLFLLSNTDSAIFGSSERQHIYCRLVRRPVDLFSLIGMKNIFNELSGPFAFL